MSLQQTERNLHNNKLSTFEQTFTKKSGILFKKQKIFVVLKGTVIYCYQSKQQYNKIPQKPQKYFNLNTLEAEIKGKSNLYLRDIQFEAFLTHENIDKLNGLLMAIENNRRNINMQVLFPKRFQELNERVNEKILENADK